MPLQGAETLLADDPGCRFACPGLWAPLGFQPALAKSETSVRNLITWQTYPLTCQPVNLSTRQLVNLFTVILLVDQGQSGVVAAVTQHLLVVRLGVVECHIGNVALGIALGVINGVDKALVG